jgi:hypothetical protein
MNSFIRYLFLHIFHNMRRYNTVQYSTAQRAEGHVVCPKPTDISAENRLSFQGPIMRQARDQREAVGNQSPDFTQTTRRYIPLDHFS